MKQKLKGSKKALIIIACIMISILAVIAGRILFLSSATTGKTIADYRNGKAALLVIDIQEDTLNVPQYSNSKELIQNINTSIEYAAENGMDIIYIKQEYSNIFDSLLTGGMYKANSKGSALSSQMIIKSDNIFSKLRSDSFSENNFEKYLIDNQIDTLYIVGADASACVYKTSLGGVNRGYHVVVLKDCLFSVNKNILNKMLERYIKDGIKVENMGEFLQSAE
ncbi:MAG: cysteine hydrolase [Clostridia bacterium]|nr:cysteine hydrolase [Clostridia bacterium]